MAKYTVGQLCTGPIKGVAYYHYCEIAGQVKGKLIRPRTTIASSMAAYPESRSFSTKRYTSKK